MQLTLSRSPEIKSVLSSWGLSDEAIAVLVNEPELVRELQQSRSLPPFPPDYMPRVIEERFDGIISCRWELGRLVYQRPCLPNYQPPFVEYCFDEQTALFHVNGEIVVNRLPKNG